MAAAAAAPGWKPHDSLTQAPTNLKEAIDWVLRVTGKDGKSNKAAQPQPPASPPQFACLCFLAKAIKDLLYDAKAPGTPGPSSERNWDGILLEQELSIVRPVLEDLGLDGSTSAASTTTTCAGGTEVIKALIDHLAQGLQKWVGWKDTGDDCCLKGEKGVSKGIGKGCTCSGGGGGATCCSSGTTCHQCDTCGTGAKGGPDTKCYLSAYCKKNTIPQNATQKDYYWPTISSDSTKVHLLARIFLGSVCLIWSGLSQLGFLTKEGSGSGKRWTESNLHEESANLGSFMAAMGYDLDRLNQGGPDKKGEFVQQLLSGKDDKTGVPWKEFTKGANESSVAEYYSSIYDKAKSTEKSTSESICKQYPLLVLHILASGYFRAGSAGAKGVTVPPTAAPSDPRKPRTIREILYWLSALPYSQGYCGLVRRMKDKTDQVTNKRDTLTLESITRAASTTLKRDCITHYLTAACGYCPLVLIGIQGTIEREVKTELAAGKAGAAAGSGTDDKRCPEHSKDPKSKRCNLDEKKNTTPAATAPVASTGNPLQAGEICYRGYHLAVKDFGPLHGMYANGLYGFDLDGSAAQCLDQLRVYVYHCFYQLYFLRKQCSAGAIAAGGAGGAGVVLGWQSCRYGYQVSTRKGGNTGGADNKKWTCEPLNGGGDQKCKCLGDGATQGAYGTLGQGSPLQSFLCDSINGMHCGETMGKGVESYPEIDAHMNKTVDHNGKEQEPHKEYPELCPVPMGWSKEASDNHFKDLTNGTHKQEDLDKSLGQDQKYPVHCTGRTLSHLLEFYCDPEQCHGSLVVLLRLLACITPTVPRTLGDLFGFYYYIVYIGGQSASGVEGVNTKLTKELGDVRLSMLGSGGNDAVVKALEGWSTGNCIEKCTDQNDTNCTLKCLVKFTCGGGKGKYCGPYLSPLSGQQYGQLSPLMAGTYLSWLVYLIEGFEGGLRSLESAFKGISCKDSECKNGVGAAGCGDNGQCQKGNHGETCSPGGSGNGGVCQCASVVSCTGVLPVLYKYGFGYGNVETLHKPTGGGSDQNKKCHDFLGTLEKIASSGEFNKLTNSINQLIYTTRLPWIFVLTIAWLVAVLYLAFGAIWPLDWTHMRSHCRGWFRKGSLSPWEILMVGKKKGRGILEFFGKT